MLIKVSKRKNSRLTISLATFHYATSHKNNRKMRRTDKSKITMSNLMTMKDKIKKVNNKLAGYKKCRK